MRSSATRSFSRALRLLIKGRPVRCCSKLLVTLSISLTVCCLGCATKQDTASHGDSEQARPASALPAEGALPAAEAIQPPAVDNTALPYRPAAAVKPTTAPDQAQINPAADRKLLRWKFTTGDVLRYELTYDQRMMIGGREYRNKKSIRFRWNVVE